MKLVVGLGNPGDEYINTRHNIGFMFLDYFYKDKFSYNKKFNAMEYITSINGEKFIFIKPYTFMNLSGEAVIKYVNYYKVNLNDIIVVQDDLDIKFGNFKLIYKHGDGGHNGIKNIVLNVGSNDFLRIKFGISKLSSSENRDYVLSKFSSDDINLLNSEFKLFDNLLFDVSNMSINLLIGKYNSINNNR